MPLKWIFLVMKMEKLSLTWKLLTIMFDLGVKLVSLLIPVCQMIKNTLFSADGEHNDPNITINTQNCFVVKKETKFAIL